MKEQLIEIINRLPGIEVVCISDPDDNKQPIKCTSSNIHRGGFTIFFHVDEKEQEGLFFLTRCVDGRYFQYGLNWRTQGSSIGFHQSLESEGLPMEHQGSSQTLRR